MLAGCFVCKKSVSGCGKYERFVTRYPFDHKECMKHFDEFKKYYFPKEPHPVDVSSETNTIVYDSKIAELEKVNQEQSDRIKELEAKLLEAQAAPPAPAPPVDFESKHNELIEKYKDLESDYESIVDELSAYKNYKRLCEKMTDLIDQLIVNNKDHATINRAAELQSEFDEMD
jgi:hypothetical protein